MVARIFLLFFGTFCGQIGQKFEAQRFFEKCLKMVKSLFLRKMWLILNSSESLKSHRAPNNWLMYVWGKVDACFCVALYVLKNSMLKAQPTYLPSWTISLTISRVCNLVLISAKMSLDYVTVCVIVYSKSMWK